MPSAAKWVRAVRRRSWAVKCSRPCFTLPSATPIVLSQIWGNMRFCAFLAGNTQELPHPSRLSSSSHSTAMAGRGMSIAAFVLVRSAGRCHTAFSRSNSVHGASINSDFRTASNSSSLMVSSFSRLKPLAVFIAANSWINSASDSARSLDFSCPPASETSKAEAGLYSARCRLIAKSKMRFVHRSTSLAIEGAPRLTMVCSMASMCMGFTASTANLPILGLMSFSIRLRTMLGCFHRPRMLRSK